MRRLSIVTLGVKNHEESKRFYCSLFDWAPTKDSDEHITFFNLDGYMLALFPWDELAKDAMVSASGSGFSGITLAHNVREKAEVAPFLKKAESLGAKILKPAQDVFWGGHSGYFADPNGHLWEIAFNPFTPTKADGFLDTAGK